MGALTRTFAILLVVLGSAGCATGRVPDGDAAAASPAAAAATELPPEWKALQRQWDEFRAAEAGLAAGGDSGSRWRARSAAVKFRRAFAAAGGNDGGPPGTEHMRRTGLRLAGVDALGCGDAASAVRAFESCLRLPRAAESDEVEAEWLPAALLASGRADEAVPLLEAAAARGDAGALLALGDSRAAVGDRAGARARWDEARTRTGEHPATAREKSVLTGAYVRKSLVGKPARDLGTGTWIGGECETLSAMRGKVVLFCVAEMTCSECRDAVRALSALRARRPTDDLVVFVVIPRSDTTWRPDPSSAVPWEEGQVRTCLDDPKYDAMVADCQRTLGIGYPMLVTDPVQLVYYAVAMQENAVVVGRDGVIAFATPGHSRIEAAIHVAERLLAAK